MGYIESQNDLSVISDRKKKPTRASLKVSLNISIAKEVEVC